VRATWSMRHNARLEAAAPRHACFMLRGYDDAYSEPMCVLSEDDELFASWLDYKEVQGWRWSADACLTNICKTCYMLVKRAVDAGLNQLTLSKL
jgi:hypothetical protein